MKINPVPPALATAYIAGALGLLPVPAAHGAPEAVSTKQPADPLCFYAIDEFTATQIAIRGAAQQMSDGSVNWGVGDAVRNFSTPAFTCPPTPPPAGVAHKYVVLVSGDLYNPKTAQLAVANPADPMREEDKSGNVKQGLSTDCVDRTEGTWRPLNAVVVAFGHDTAGQR